MTSERVIDFRYAPDTAWTLICPPDDPHKTLVAQHATLLYGFEQTHLGGFSFRRTVELRAQTRQSPTAIRQRTESAVVPIVRTTIDYPSCRLELWAAGQETDDGRRRDLVLWSLSVAPDVPRLLTGLHIDVYERDRRHAGAGPAPDHRVFAMPRDAMPDYPLFLSETVAHDEDEPGDLLLTSGPQRLAVTHPTGFRPASGFQTEPVVVAGGGTIHGAVVLPLDGADIDDLTTQGTGSARPLDPVLVADAVDTVRSSWHQRDDLRLPIRVPDPDLQDMLVAASRNLVQAREPDEDGVPVFQVGPTVYRGLWVVDGHFLLEAARYLHLQPCGPDDDPRRAVRPLLARVRQDGSINALADVADPTKHPHTKETGIGITTLVRQWELTGDHDWLRQVWPVIHDGVRHVERLRTAAFELPEDSPAYGLMPPAFADGGAAGVRPELTTALWTATGLGYAARAARALSERSDAEWIERLARQLRADIDRVIGEHAGTLPDGRRYTPLVLPGSGDHHTVADADPPSPDHELRPQTATWALAQAIWPGELFGPDEPVVTDYLHLLDSIEREDVPVETGWLPYRALWTYYASFAAHVQLYADRPERALSLLYGMCNHAAPTRVWREEQALREDDDSRIWGDMPHNWASAELVRLVRHLMVFEVGEELRLLAGVPPAWLSSGGLAAERTPTRFGLVSLRVDDGVVHVDLSETRRLPQRCVVRIPDGTWRVKLRDSTGPPRVRELHDPGWVELPLQADHHAGPVQ